MIVDVHTQVWDCNASAVSAGITESKRGDAARHLAALDPVDLAIVLAFKSRYLQTEISNRFVADYVRRYSAKMIGFAGIDPTDPAWRTELSSAQEELQLKGVTVCPSLQNYHPSDTRAMALYGECHRRGMPVLFEQNLRNPAAKMEFARPMLLDEIAREYPQLRIVIAHVGFPWVAETITLLGKHPHVYADVAGLLRQPWQTYNTMLAAFEYGVMDKLLFGSDFPYRSPAECIEALYSINLVAGGTNLTSIPREQLRGIVERDALKLLGIEPPRSSTPVARQRSVALVDEES